MYRIYPAELKNKSESCPGRYCNNQLVTVGTDTKGEGPSYFTTVEGTLCAYVSATTCPSNGSSTTLFEYYHLNKKEAQNKMIKIVKHIQKSSAISARVQLLFPEMEDGQCFKKLKTSDSAVVIRERMIELLHINFMKPDHIRIKILDCSPSETDLEITKFDIEHQVDMALLAETLPPLQSLRMVVENFSSGLALSHLRFYWAKGFLDVEALLEGFRVIYRGEVGKPCCKRNFAYVQAVEDGPVLSVAYGSCQQKDCGKTYDYNSGSRLRSLYDLSFIVRG